jgi:hypothetical protein
MLDPAARNCSTMNPVEKVNLKEDKYRRGSIWKDTQTYGKHLNDNGRL